MRAVSKREPSLVIDSAWGCGVHGQWQFPAAISSSDKCRIPKRHGVTTASLATESDAASSVIIDMWLRGVFVKNNCNYKNYEQQKHVIAFPEWLPR